MCPPEGGRYRERARFVTQGLKGATLEDARFLNEIVLNKEEL